MNEIKSILPRKLLSNYTTVKSSTFWKVSFKPYNFRVPVYKGVIHPWMKWKPSLHDEYYLTIDHSINFLYLKSEFAKHPTLGFPFI